MCMHSYIMHLIIIFKKLLYSIRTCVWGMSLYNLFITSRSMRVSRESSQFSVESWLMSLMRDLTHVTEVSVTNRHKLLHKSCQDIKNNNKLLHVHLSLSLSLSLSLFVSLSLCLSLSLSLSLPLSLTLSLSVLLSNDWKKSDLLFKSNWNSFTAVGYLKKNKKIKIKKYFTQTCTCILLLKLSSAKWNK